jgi:hypothetical protein
MNAKTARRALFLVCAVALPAQAADFGLGAAFNDGLTVLVPIKTGSWLIEPELRISTQSTAAGGKQSIESYSAGAGFYARKEMGPLFESYFGARVSYSWGEQSQPGSDSKVRSWGVAPTLGVQHFFSKQFSVGLDAGLRYTTSETKISGAGSSTASEHGWDSVSRILVRAYFW